MTWSRWLCATFRSANLARDLGEGELVFFEDFNALVGMWQGLAFRVIRELLDRSDLSPKDRLNWLSELHPDRSDPLIAALERSLSS